MAVLNINNKAIQLPAFFPDATHGFVKSTGADDLLAAGTTGIVVNTFHSICDDNINSVEKVGGIHQFTHFPGVIITDSGGFQAMSLIRRNSQNGKINDEGVVFKNPKDNSKVFLTPELCIKHQARLKSDIIMCLDDCTDPSEALVEQKLSVERTIAWAKRCKETYLNTFKNKAIKPLIFAIIQGGNSLKLRKYCADELKIIGFDGYAFGGWPVDQNKKFMSKILKYTVEQMPQDKPKYAMGVGKPENIKSCIKMGYNLFDCVLPTRDARHERLYVNHGKSYQYLYIGSQKYKNDKKPISGSCDCLTCKSYSRFYLYNLFKNKDPLALRLATIHNLKFYNDYLKRFSL
jgi:queuine tRNA-ribosyltransferase